MKKFNVKTGISAALLALSLVVTAIPANAAKLDATTSATELNQLGAATFGAPQASIKEQTADGQITTSWTFNYVPPTYVDSSDNKTKGPTVYMIVYNKGDRTNPDYGSVKKDWLGNLIPSGYSVGSYRDPESYKSQKYETTLGSSQLTPGKKEVIFYVYDSKAYNTDLTAARKTAHDAWVAAGSQGTDPDYESSDKILSSAAYYYYSAPIEIDVSMEPSVYTSVTATSIELKMDGAIATGYEISKKAGSKYVVVANVAARVYKDNGLESKKEYSYKVRPYYIDVNTNEKTYGKYTEVSAVTRGSALKLTSKVNNKNKVVLSWAKVADATKYEIYRTETSSYASSKSKGLTNVYDNMKLIATVKKNKKSYTDKAVSANRSYSYRVRAVLAKDKADKKDKGYFVEAYTSASLNFSQVSINVTSDYTDANGNRTIEWSKVYGADGYLVEREVYNTTTEEDDWVPVTTLGKTATKYQFTAIGQTDKDGKITSYSDTYRIRATRKGEYSSAATYTTTKKLGVVSKVTATKAANGIQVSWTPVAGASYYKVLRIPASAVIDNKDLGGYVNSGYEVTEYVGVTEARAVDVAAWNAAVDADIAAYKAAQEAWSKDETGTLSYPDYDSYWHESDKLSANKTYHYQNYSYARSTFDANTTSIIDYCGDIYKGDAGKSLDTTKATLGADGKISGAQLKWYVDPVCDDDDVYKGNLRAGVDYQYYVVAYADIAMTAADYDWGDWVLDQAAFDAAKAAYEANQKAWDAYYDSFDSQTGNYDESIKPTERLYEPSEYDRVYDDNGDSVYDENGRPVYKYRKYAQYSDDSKMAYYTNGFALNTAYVPGAKSAGFGQAVAVIDSSNFKGPAMSTSAVKSIGQATFTSKAAPTGKAAIKSVKCSKKVATIKFKKAAGADGYKIYRATKKKGKYYSVGVTTKTSFKDAGLTAKQTYYYKVVPFTVNEANAEVEGKASAVKKVKAK